MTGERGAHVRPSRNDRGRALSTQLHRAGWSIGSTAYATTDGGLAWAVDGWNGEKAIRAAGSTEVVAWREAIGQAVACGKLGDVRPGTDPETGKSKSDTAMVNESLCKILCHNLCCLIQSQYELGVEATFWGEAEEASCRDQSCEADEMIEAMAWV